MSVRLRSAVLACARTLRTRHLIVAAGIVAAGWLLGGAGAAHAGTIPAAHAVLGPATHSTHGHAGRTGRTRDHSGAGGHSKDTGRVDGRSIAGATRLARGAGLHLVKGASVPEATAASRTVNGDLARPVRTTGSALHLRPAAGLGSSGDIRRVITNLVSSTVRPDHGGHDAWTPRRHPGVDAGTNGRAAGPARTRPLAVGASGLQRAGGASAASHPAPAPWHNAPRPPSPQPGAVLPSAGSSLAGGNPAHLTKTELMAQPAVVRLPAPYAIPPATHSAADEPSFAPD